MAAAGLGAPSAPRQRLATTAPQPHPRGSAGVRFDLLAYARAVCEEVLTPERGVDGIEPDGGTTILLLCWR